jgi:hypothetical protein
MGRFSASRIDEERDSSDKWIMTGEDRGREIPRTCAS